MDPPGFETTGRDEQSSEGSSEGERRGEKRVCPFQDNTGRKRWRVDEECSGEGEDYRWDDDDMDEEDWSDWSVWGYDSAEDEGEWGEEAGRENVQRGSTVWVLVPPQSPDALGRNYIGFDRVMTLATLLVATVYASWLEDLREYLRGYFAHQDEFTKW